MNEQEKKTLAQDKEDAKSIRRAARNAKLDSGQSLHRPTRIHDPSDYNKRDRRNAKQSLRNLGQMP